MPFESAEIKHFFWSKVGIKFVFLVTEREVGKKGETKKIRGLWGNFPLELFVRITFPFYWVFGSFSS